VVYASRFINRVKQNYNTTQREALAMVFFCTRKIVRWFLFFLEDDFIIVYK
jgi:hypothetical protein